MTKAPDLNDLRARRDQLDQQLADATIAPTEELMALLGSDELTQLLDRVTAAASSLDEATRRRIEQWVRAREALVKLSGIELARLRKLVS